ncbi:hypothetical protein HCU01_13740 [Halomonas cupida]|uniref:DUF4401 domain-containing protein n=1 Tax=Halomonas cupida TaxID=44933 RepID=A0A1M7F7F9_9GAMM|nr:DUF4401 domain-containing protein [Halomonas cupida]GEN23425.1 hypothetical protein HCU01_13740 [Halomonas cupida]SHL99607.1 protein of unknown function [Halomonas cupida]
MKDTTVAERLARAGVDVSDEAAAPPLETPEAVRALQAFSGWLAALLLLGAIAAGVAFVVESPAIAGGLGVVSIIVAWFMLRVRPGDFVEHLALAISLVGQLLVAWALADQLAEGLGWALLGLQMLLALLMPSLVHRAFSAFAASLALYLALADGGLYYLADGLLVLALVGIWLSEFRYSGYLRAMQAWGHGVLLGLLVIQGVAVFGQSLSGWRMSADSPPGWLGPWLGDALGALALVVLLRYLFREGRLPVGARDQAIAYGAVAGLMLISCLAHGLMLGAVVVVLGFAIGHRSLLAAGVLLLLFSIGGYYYWLDATLLFKALTLFALGASLLLLRWVLRWRMMQRGGQR